jgi:hypothetical protein
MDFSNGLRLLFTLLFHAIISSLFKDTLQGQGLGLR